MGRFRGSLPPLLTVVEGLVVVVLRGLGAMGTFGLITMGVLLAEDPRLEILPLVLKASWVVGALIMIGVVLADDSRLGISPPALKAS